MDDQGTAPAIDRRPKAGSEHPRASGAGTTFACPRCRLEYPLRFLASRWSEWGQLCWCAESGEFNPACVAFVPKVRGAIPRPSCAGQASP